MKLAFPFFFVTLKKKSAEEYALGARLRDAHGGALRPTLSKPSMVRDPMYNN